jgi:hypothetical protein
MAAAPTAFAYGGWWSRLYGHVTNASCNGSCRRQGPAALSNGGSRLVLQKFQTTIYFGKIVEKNIKNPEPQNEPKQIEKWTEERDGPRKPNDTQHHPILAL